MIIRRLVSVAIGAVFATSLAAISAPAALAQKQIVWQFPSNTQCPLAQGLQACIDKTGSGDILEIDEDPLAGQSGTINHSLTLEPQPGLDPTLGALSVNDLTAVQPMSVLVQGLTFIGEVHAATSVIGDSLTLRDVEVAEQGTGGDNGILLRASASAAFAVIHSTVSFDADAGAGIGFVAEGSAHVTATAIGNRVSPHGTVNSLAGIALAASGTSSIRADLDNNVVTQTGGCLMCSGGGIWLGTQDTGQLTANVVGNTVDGARAGVTDSDALVLDNQDGAGSISAKVFNNVFSRSSQLGIGTYGGGHNKLSAGYNDFWHNHDGDTSGGTAPGSHNLHKDPKFVDPAHEDLRLTAASPVIDKGLVCSPGGVANLDAAGHGRLHGASVDLGAFERGAGTPTGVALVGTGAGNTLTGTSGDDILCGMGGNDTLDGKAGNDYVDGGAGNDTLTGGPGSDRLFGESGADTLCARDGTHGNDRLDGGPGTDGFKADPGDVKTNVEHAASC